MSRAELSRLIETTRKRQHLTQAQLAARAGVSVNTVYLLESQADTRVSTLEKVLSVIGAKFTIAWE